MASWIRPAYTAAGLFACGVFGFASGFAATSWALHRGKGLEYALSTDAQSKEHEPHPKPPRFGRSLLEDLKNEDYSAINGKLSAGCRCSCYQLKLEREEFGDIVFTRVHNGTFTEVKLHKKDILELQSSRLKPYFYVTVKPDQDVGNKKCFMCKLNVQKETTDIYNIFSMKIDDKTVFRDTGVEKPQVIDEEKLKKYLEKNGITQEFLYFLTDTFIPEYREAYYNNLLADVIDDETA